VAMIALAALAEEICWSFALWSQVCTRRVARCIRACQARVV